MTLTGGSRSSLRKNCPSVTVSITSLARTDSGSSSGPCCKKLVTNSLNHGTSHLKTTMTLQYMSRFSSYLIENTACFHFKDLCYTFILTTNCPTFRLFELCTWPVQYFLL
jgi:hypothetical protein